MERQISACGADCGACNFFKQCGGCTKVEGKVFYRNGDVCPIYNCAAKKKAKNCGECDILNCKTYMAQKDPRLTDEQFKEWVNVKISNLKSS